LVTFLYWNVVAQYPPFGREMREKEFMFAEGLITFNHGSFGSPPREVIEARRRIEDECEANPDIFIRGGYQKYLLQNRERIAKYLNSKQEDLVFIENASAGINSVLRSTRLQPGDVILELSIAYPTVKNTINWLVGFDGIEVEIVDVVFPGKGQPPTGIQGSLLESVEAAFIKHGGKVKLASFCHIASIPGVVLPVEDLARLSKRYGASVFLDGAHALGNIPVDLTSLEAAGADYWLGNGHKWLYSPKGSALLWVTKSKQDSIIPTVISSEFNSVYLDRFQYTGTRDYTPYCAIGAALDFRTAVGEEKIMDYNRELALWAESYLADFWKTEVMVPTYMTGMMSNVRLPVKDGNQMGWLKTQLLDEYNMQVSTYVMTNVVTKEESFWMRISAQIYLERDDFVRLGLAVSELVQNMPTTFEK